ncbi:hypothetical protein CASFOL_011727 [Castilleja foliolosa]|uniref:Uncharacterized protein n=1 Tax=Castilleja foliolosa TaxID=1961234 RepID=A0ABD3DU66_9LAMI
MMLGGRRLADWFTSRAERGWLRWPSGADTSRAKAASAVVMTVNGGLTPVANYYHDKKRNMIGNIRVVIQSTYL